MQRAQMFQRPEPSLLLNYEKSLCTLHSLYSSQTPDLETQIARPMGRWKDMASSRRHSIVVWGRPGGQAQAESTWHTKEMALDKTRTIRILNNKLRFLDLVLQHLEAQIFDLIRGLDGDLPPPIGDVPQHVVAGHALCPDGDAVNAALADVQYDASDVVALWGVKGLADEGEHSVDPGAVDGVACDLRAPLAALLEGWILPLGPDAVLEEAVRVALGQP
jgi:hypothetical protein